MPTTDKKKQKKNTDTAVQGTNDSSVVSKASAAARGYFRDTFLHRFVSKVTRRAPLINRGYYVRWRAVESCLSQFLQVTAKCPKRQILSLGAGFDSLFFRAFGALDAAVVFELDFPSVARRKAALIGSDQTLLAMLDGAEFPPAGPVLVSSPRFVLLGLDLRERPLVDEALEAGGLDRAAPTLVLSEVVLTYMDTDSSDAVIGWAAQLLPQSLFVMYEQIHPADAFGRIMTRHFEKLNSPLHALRRYPDAAAQSRRFLEKGWERCVCLDMNDFYLGLVSQEERDRVESLEPFDEHEEWNLKCSHYFVLTASRGALLEAALLPQAKGPGPAPPWSPAPLGVRPLPLRLEGVAMATAGAAPGLVLLTGGADRGGRRAGTRILLKDRGGWTSMEAEPLEQLGVRLHHTATPLPGGGALVFGGRSSPLRPAAGLFRVTFDPPAGAQMQPLVCSGQPPAPRWRHTATVVRLGDRDFLFVFGGKNQSDPVLGSGGFLSLDQREWTALPVGGAAPPPRHSHSACPFGGGLVLFGGLGADGVAVGDAALLRPDGGGGFCWETLEVRPPPVPRYSHRAHVVGGRLVAVGGVWTHGAGQPGVLLVDLNTGSSAEFRLDTASVPWPLLLLGFCSEHLDPGEPLLLLLGGGGSCFSFGTHLNPQPVTLDLRPALG
ncbi:LOW QUALITY PROTEIN: tRNA wybutosine-synthesizing protein 4 [Menidia menidia]